MMQVESCMVLFNFDHEIYVGIGSKNGGWRIALVGMVIGIGNYGDALGFKGEVWPTP